MNIKTNYQPAPYAGPVFVMQQLEAGNMFYCPPQPSPSNLYTKVAHSVVRHPSALPDDANSVNAVRMSTGQLVSISNSQQVLPIVAVQLTAYGDTR